MSRIVLVHGIHGHGKEGIDKFGKALTKVGFNVVEFEYPIRWALPMYFNNAPRNDAKSLLHLMKPGDHVIAHSYGCLIFQETIKLGAQWDKCFLFAGACTSEKMYYPGDSLNEAYVIYNPEDKALLLGCLLPFHPFGKLGLVGYRGQPGRKERDFRFENVPGFKEDGLLNHSHFWKDIPYWQNYVVNKIAMKP